MAPDLLSNADFARLTSGVVAACCQATPIDAFHLPALIASVNKALRTQIALLADETSSIQPVPCLHSMGDRHALDRPQHTLRMAPIQVGQGEALRPDQGASAPGATNIVSLRASRDYTPAACLLDPIVGQQKAPGVNPEAVRDGRGCMPSSWC